MGSEDALSASGSENTPLHNHQNSHQSTIESRIHGLEKEVAHWRSQYELSKLYTDSLKSLECQNISHDSKTNTSCSTTTTAAGLTIIPSFSDGKRYLVKTIIEYFVLKALPL